MGVVAIEDHQPADDADNDVASLATCPSNRYSQSTILGYAIWRVIVDEVELLNLSVDTKFRHRGVASRLLEYLIDEALAIDNMVTDNTQVILDVRDSNQAAIRLYSRYGFEKVAHRHNFYTTGDSRHAFTMCLPLNVLRA